MTAMMWSALKTLMVPKVAGVFKLTRVHSWKWSINIKRLCGGFKCNDSNYNNK